MYVECCEGLRQCVGLQEEQFCSTSYSIQDLLHELVSSVLDLNHTCATFLKQHSTSSFGPQCDGFTAEQLARPIKQWNRSMVETWAKSVRNTIPKLGSPGSSASSSDTVSGSLPKDVQKELGLTKSVSANSGTPASVSHQSLPDYLWLETLSPSERRGFVVFALQVFSQALYIWRSESGKKPFHLNPPQCLALILIFLKEDTTDTVSGGNLGRILQVLTGEGKSVIVAALSTIYALIGKKVDVLTTTMPLAKRDADENASLFNLFHVTVGHTSEEHLLGAGGYSTGAKDCYRKDIVYSTATQLQFDILRDEFHGFGTLAGRYIKGSGPLKIGPPSNGSSEKMPEIELPFVKNSMLIADEADSLLVDEKKNMAKLAQPMAGFELLSPILFFMWDKIDLFAARIVSEEARGTVPQGSSQADLDEENLFFGFLDDDVEDDENEKITKFYAMNGKLSIVEGQDGKRRRSDKHGPLYKFIPDTPAPDQTTSEVFIESGLENYLQQYPQHGTSLGTHDVFQKSVTDMLSEFAICFLPQFGLTENFRKMCQQQYVAHASMREQDLRANLLKVPAYLKDFVLLQVW